MSGIVLISRGMSGIGMATVEVFREAGDKVLIVVSGHAA